VSTHTLYNLVAHQLFDDLKLDPVHVFQRAEWRHKAVNLQPLVERLMREQPLTLKQFFPLMHFVAEQLRALPPCSEIPAIEHVFECDEAAPNLYAVALRHVHDEVAESFQEVVALTLSLCRDRKWGPDKFTWQMSESIRLDMSALGFLTLLDVYMVIWGLNREEAL
jgi:hypothetical protein